MTAPIITVRGTNTAWRDAERATVRVTVGFDGRTRDAVFASATESVQDLRASVIALYDAERGPITWWSADAVRVWAERPWNDKGMQLEPVHHAALDLTAKFSNFHALATWLEEVVHIAGTSVAAIEWALTEETEKAVTTEVQTLAVADAIAKATVFARGLGLTSVTAIAVADPGMLGDSAAGMTANLTMAKYDRMAMTGDTQLDLKPEQIEISATVDGRFTAH